MVDGLKIPIQKSGDESTQNAYYNGWLHSHFIGYMLVFSPLGGVVACTLNAPGSWHDSYIAENGKFYDKLKKIYDEFGGIAVVVAAFSKKHCPFMIKSGKWKPGKTVIQTTIHSQATSLRQSAEWGMRAVKGSFPRLKDKLLLCETLEDH